VLSTLCFLGKVVLIALSIPQDTPSYGRQFDVVWPVFALYFVGTEMLPTGEYER